MAWFNDILYILFWYPVEFAFYIVAICYMADRMGWYNFKLKVVKKDVPASFGGGLQEAGSFFKNMNSMYKQVSSSLAGETSATSTEVVTEVTKKTAETAKKK
tara:strand:+ start:3162 stop:3467 length:306 start_codon:yes stop_codon:yes gene_type:complete